MRLSIRTILLAVILAVTLAAQKRPIDRGIEKWQTTEVYCGGIHNTDCQCWEEDASDCKGEEICHWCPGAYTAPLYKIPEGEILSGDAVVTEWGTIGIDIPPPDPNAGREIDLFNEDGKTVVFASVNEGFKIYPSDVGPIIVIHPDCTVSINRNPSLEQILGGLVKLIATTNVNLIEHLCFPK